MSSAALRVLLAELIDYAGLFPPASLAVPEAAASFAQYRASADAWALGRFVVPVARLDELASAAAMHLRDGDAAWRVSALVGDDPSRDADVVAAWNSEHCGRLNVDVVEVRASTADHVAAAASALGAAITTYVEIPVAGDPMPLLQAIARANARAKIRTGGIDATAFPTAQQVARFILRCREMDVAFKATAGLHHPIRAEHRLTYAADAPRGMMFGFLNVFLASAFAHAGALSDVEALAALLEERDARAFKFSGEGVHWRRHSISVATMAGARAKLAIAFGSCSFREPIDDLQQIGLL